MNRRRLNVAASTGEDASSLIRKLEITPARINCTDARTAAGTHRA